MGNPLAFLTLLIWPLVCLILFRRLKLERALVWSLLGAYLFLPPLTEFDFPLVPSMDKVTIPNLTVLLLIVYAKKLKVEVLPSGQVARLLVIGFVFCAIPSVVTNRDPIIFEVLGSTGPITFLVDQLPGQSIRDIGSVFIGQVLMLVPFLLGRQFLADEKGQREICLAFMVGALIYTIPSLIEIRLSPQMNIWIYGYFQHSFDQMIRSGGFRPIVFLPHGLWLALFMCMGLMAAVAMVRVTPQQDRWKAYLIVGYLFVVLVLCKSLASLVYATFMVPVLLFTPPRWQIWLALSFGVVAVTYPMLRNFDLVPLSWFLEQAYAYDPARHQSLNYRFHNEAALLERAAEKPFFGWGGWGRNLVRHMETGEILTIPDGRWIIVFGVFGWLGYICEFGLLALPLFLAWRVTRRQKDLPPFLAPLCLMLGITMVDMLLNATLTSITWLTAGSILGYAEKNMPEYVKKAKYQMAPAAMDTPATPLTGKRTVL